MRHAYALGMRNDTEETALLLGQPDGVVRPARVTAVGFAPHVRVGRLIFVTGDRVDEHAEDGFLELLDSPAPVEPEPEPEPEPEVEVEVEVDPGDAVESVVVREVDGDEVPVDLHSMKRDTLRDLARERGLPLWGTKEELIARLLGGE